MEVVETTGAIRRAKLHQQTNTQFFYRPEQAGCPSSHLALTVMELL